MTGPISSAWGNSLVSCTEQGLQDCCLGMWGKCSKICFMQFTVLNPPDIYSHMPNKLRHMQLWKTEDLILYKPSTCHITMVVEGDVCMSGYSHASSNLSTHQNVAASIPIARLGCKLRGSMLDCCAHGTSVMDSCHRCVFFNLIHSEPLLLLWSQCRWYSTSKGKQWKLSSFPSLYTISILWNIWKHTLCK